MARAQAYSSSTHDTPQDAPPLAGPWAAALANLPPSEPTAPEFDTVYLWPCNVRAWLAWQAVQTQWRTGMGGATVLDYAGVWAWLHAQRARPKQLRAWFAGIQAAEHATLQVWHEQRLANDKKPT